MLTRARSGVTRFHHELLGPDRPLGTLDMPESLPYATRPGTRAPEGACVTITLPGDRLRIEYDVARSGWIATDLRFRLVRDLEELASADGNRREWKVSAGPDAWTFRNRSNLLRVRFELLRDERPVGEIAEASLWAWVRRDFRLDLPEALPDGVRAFLYFLAWSSAIH